MAQTKLQLIKCIHLLKQTPLSLLREEVFNSDDNEGGKEGNGYEANPYDQYINSIKYSDLTRFKDLLSK